MEMKKLGTFISGFLLPFGIWTSSQYFNVSPPLVLFRKNSLSLLYAHEDLVCLHNSSRFHQLYHAFREYTPSLRIGASPNISPTREIIECGVAIGVIHCCIVMLATPKILLHDVIGCTFGGTVFHSPSQQITLYPSQTRLDGVYNWMYQQCGPHGNLYSGHPAVLKSPTVTVCYIRTYEGQTWRLTGGLGRQRVFAIQEGAFKLLKLHGFSQLGLSSRNTISNVSFLGMITRVLAGT